MSANPTCQPAGVPSGGQFSAPPRSEPGVAFDAHHDIDDLRTRIQTACENGLWSEVAPLVDRLAATNWRPACPACGAAMRWERDMAEPGEQWLWCEACSVSYESDTFPAL